MDFQYITAINSELLNRKILNNCIENNENIIIKVIKTENRDNYNESEDKDPHKDIETTDNFEKQSNHSIIDNLGEKCKDLMPSNDKNDNNISLNNKSENSSLLRLLLLNKTESRDKFEDQFCEELNERQISFETIYKTESNDSEDNDNTFNDEYMDSFEMGFHLRHKYNNETQSHKNISNNNLNTNEFKCDINDCKYTTHNDKCLKAHKTEAHIKPYFCKLCDNKFGKNITLINHMKKEHKGVKPYVCSEDNCNESYYSLTELRRHESIHKNKDNIVICGHNGCERRYLGLRSSESLHRHQMSKHPELFPNLKTYICGKNGCEFSTKSKSAFDYHIGGHEEIKRYICEVCGKAYVREIQLKDHMKIHSGVKHVCDWKDCNKSFARRYLLYKHQLRHKGIKKYVCDWNNCGKKFYCTQELKDHMNGHTGHKPYPCLWPECGKTFRTKTHFILHMKIHRNDKRYVCDWPECQYKTICKTSLDQHKCIHTGLKRFVCDWPQCHYKCTTSSRLKKHKKRHNP